jgi:hypothetical protein
MPSTGEFPPAGPADRSASVRTPGPERRGPKPKYVFHERFAETLPRRRGAADGTVNACGKILVWLKVNTAWANNDFNT